MARTKRAELQSAKALHARARIDRRELQEIEDAARRDTLRRQTLWLVFAVFGARQHAKWRMAALTRDDILAARARAKDLEGAKGKVVGWWRNMKMRRNERSLPSIRRMAKGWVRRHRARVRNEGADALVDFLTACRKANKNSVSRSMRRARRCVRLIQKFGRDFCSCRAARLELLGRVLDREEARKRAELLERRAAN